MLSGLICSLPWCYLYCSCSDQDHLHFSWAKWIRFWITQVISENRIILLQHLHPVSIRDIPMCILASETPTVSIWQWHQCKNHLSQKQTHPILFLPSLWCACLLCRNCLADVLRQDLGCFHVTVSLISLWYSCPIQYWHSHETLMQIVPFFKKRERPQVHRERTDIVRGQLTYNKELW